MEQPRAALAATLEWGRWVHGEGSGPLKLGCQCGTAKTCIIALLTAAQGASQARGKPLAQLVGSEQQTLFSWSVMPLSKKHNSRSAQRNAGHRGADENRRVGLDRDVRKKDSCMVVSQEGGLALLSVGVELGGRRGGQRG